MADSQPMLTYDDVKGVQASLTSLERRCLISGGDPEELVDLKVWEWNKPNNL